MADITLSHITPKHFHETVKLLKMNEHKIYLSVNSIEVRFDYIETESRAVTSKRFEQLEHFMHFLEDLVNSDVPIDLDEFIKMYRKNPGVRYFSKRR